MSHLLTVFRVSEDNHGDVDVAILQALLKGGDDNSKCSTRCILPLMLFLRKTD